METVDALVCDLSLNKARTTLNCLEGNGVSYIGDVSVTEGGFQCQEWSKQVPNPHPYQGLGEHNHCRNPNGLEARPWCYLTDQSSQWDFCDVPVCNEDLKEERTITYHANRCGNSPHDDHMTGAWCRSSKNKKTLCAVRQCTDMILEALETLETLGALDRDALDAIDALETLGALGALEVKGDLEDYSFMYYSYSCMRAENLGAGYRGSINTTQSGYECQRWDEQSPHAHSIHLNPVKGIGEHNFCRNPDGEPRPWCYTTELTPRWDLCDVPYCTTIDNDSLLPVLKMLQNVTTN